MTRFLNNIDFTKSGSMVNSISFLSLSITEYIQSMKIKNNLRHKTIYQTSSLLLFIAGIHYAILDVNRPTIEQEIYIRYSDWIFTTPLLLKVLGDYYNISQKKINIWIMFDLLMVITGLIYEKTGNVFYWTIGTISYFILLGLLYTQLPERDLFYRYFVVGWSGYGIVSRLERPNRPLYYNILDFYNKFVFAIDIQHKLHQEKKE